MSGQTVPRLLLRERSATIRFAFDDRLGLFLRGVQHALGDFDVFKRKIVLIGRQLLGLRAELLTPQIVDDALQPTSRFLGGGKRRLMLRQAPTATAPGALSGQRFLPPEKRSSCA